MTKKWFLVPGFIGIVFLIAGFLIQDCLLFLFKWNLITRYPVIFNFRVGTGRVLKKKFGTGRVPGSRRTLVMTLSRFCVPDNHCENKGLVSGKTCKLVDKPSRAIFALATIVRRTPTPKWISLERKLKKWTHLKHLENPTPPLPLRYLCETPYIAVKSFAWARHKLVSYKSMLVMKILR